MRAALMVTLALGTLLAPEAAAVGPSPHDESWSAHLGLVDQLAWAATDRQVRHYLRDVHRDLDTPFARSLRADARPLLRKLGPHTFYAVEAELLEDFSGVDRRLVHLRQAVIYTNRSRRPITSLTFRVFANGEHVFPESARVLDARVGVHPVPHDLEGSLLTVQLPEPLRPGRSTRVLLELLEDIQPFDPSAGAAQTDRLTAEDVGGLGYAGEYVHLGGFLAVATPIDRDGQFDRRPLPVNGEYAVFDPATFHVVFELDADRQLATSGIELARRSDDERQSVVAVAALTRDFAASTGRGLEVSTVELDEVTLRLFHDADEPLMGRHMGRWSREAWQVLVDTYGPPTMAEVDVVEGPLAVALGQEFHGLTIVDLRDDDGSYFRSDDHAWTIAHELAHQWWSADVGSDARDAPWLDEALSSHGSALVWESIHGRQAVEERFLIDAIDPAADMAAEGVADLPADLPASDYVLWQYSVIVYGRAALFVDRIRQLLGPDAFARAMSGYANRFRGRQATSDDLLDAWRREASDPDEVDRLYERWIRSPAADGLLESP